MFLRVFNLLCDRINSNNIVFSSYVFRLNEKNELKYRARSEFKRQSHFQCVLAI